VEPGQQGADLVRTVLDDRYHGTMRGVAQETQLPTATIGRLLELAAAAGLVIIGRLIAEHGWSARELNHWLRPYQVAAEAAPAVVAAAPPLAAPSSAGAASWLAPHTSTLLLAVSFIALVELGYMVVSTHSTFQ
jgi:OOP family OmpA-OmpF porin